MTVEKKTWFLLEDLPQKLRKIEANEKVAAIANRLALLIFNVPSLQSFLIDSSIILGNEHVVKLQFDFLKLPKEVLGDIERLLCLNQFKDYRFLKYIKNGQARTGLEIEIDPQKDLPGTAYDYAF